MTKKERVARIKAQNDAAKRAIEKQKAISRATTGGLLFTTNKNRIEVKKFVLI